MEVLPPFLAQNGTFRACRGSVVPVETASIAPHSPAALIGRQCTQEATTAGHSCEIGAKMTKNDPKTAQNTHFRTKCTWMTHLGRVFRTLSPPRVHQVRVGRLGMYPLALHIRNTQISPFGAPGPFSLQTACSRVCITLGHKESQEDNHMFLGPGIYPINGF